MYMSYALAGFLVSTLLVFPSHAILAIFHIANVFLSGFTIPLSCMHACKALITVALSLAIIIIIYSTFGSCLSESVVKAFTQAALYSI